MPELGLGLASGLSQNLVPFGANLPFPKGTPAFELGRGVGQMLGGLVQMAEGLGMIFGGGAASTTGVGALVGVPALVEGMLFAGSGALAIGAGASTLVDALNANNSFSQGEGSGGRPEVKTNLPDRVTKELPPGQGRTSDEVKQTRNFFERNRAAARQWWSERSGRPWPKGTSTHDEHPRPLKDGGDPLFVEPGTGGPNRPHMQPGPDGLTDFQRWGLQGGRPRNQLYGR